MIGSAALAIALRARGGGCDRLIAIPFIPGSLNWSFSSKDSREVSMANLYSVVFTEPFSMLLLASKWFWKSLARLLLQKRE